MPSGKKVYADVYRTYMNIRISVAGNPSIEGMAGSPDSNPDNDLKIQGMSTSLPPLAGGLAGPQAPTEVVDSWR